MFSSHISPSHISPQSLIEAYGSPLYVYDERTFREKCRAMKAFCPYPHYTVNYAIKANSNLTLLKIAREEGLRTDVSSVGEAIAALAAGFDPKDIFFIVNNAAPEELRFAIEKGLPVSVDSLSQLETYGRLYLETREEEGLQRPTSPSRECNPSSSRGIRGIGGIGGIGDISNICVRFNTGIGAGHHRKVVTGGDDTKFGVLPADIPKVKKLLMKYNLRLSGINHHIGSQYAQELYLVGAKALIDIARNFDGLDFLDFGGGFYIPYHKMDGEKPFDLKPVGEELARMMREFSIEYGKPLTCMVEPGRYIAAECGVLLGTVTSVKRIGAARYVGCDIGFSAFARPTLYDAHHDIMVYPAAAGKETVTTTDIALKGVQPLPSPPRHSGTSNLYPSRAQVTHLVGNQCETGDYVAKNRPLPPLTEGDIIAVQDAGAYGYSMASQYNMRPRPAEVLICEDGTVKLIRRRDTHEGMLANMQGLC
ncbi:MAG: diaminopimelate decarboxylase [Defluviitaleaceae bacterium]|nr:diaminopimelate decarboxylase [Defluviitaleaceae bacterium]